MVVSRNPSVRVGSEHVSEFQRQRIPYVVRDSDRANETCPIFPGGFLYLDWGLDDPAAAEGTESERPAVFHRVRDEIKEQVREFIARES